MSPLYPTPHRPLFEAQFARRLAFAGALRDAGGDVVDDVDANLFVELSAPRAVTPRSF